MSIKTLPSDPHLGNYFDRLTELCAIDSPTGHQGGIRQTAELLASWAARSGCEAELLDSAVGLHLRASLPGAGSQRVLFVGHHDTVYPVGTTRDRPVRAHGGRLLGPGVADMKGGLLLALFAMSNLSRGARPFRSLELYSVPDEEARSTAPAILDRLRGADAALVFECGRPSGALVTSRKASAWLEITATGRSGHPGAGSAFGRSALAALAMEVVRVESLDSAGAPGLSMIVTRFNSGEADNVIPPNAKAVIDLRAPTADGIRSAIDAVARFHPHDGIDFHLGRTGGFPPMRRHAPLATKALEALREVGEDAFEESVGGSSDACWISAAGIPTVDGFGPVGGDDHSPGEYIVTRSVAPRIRAVVSLVNAISAVPQVEDVPTSS